MEILLFILGTLFGSFYLVIGTRLPLKENVITGRSRCDSCHHILNWYDLIPIVSYVFKGGKCSYCGKKISIDHIVVEILTGLLFLVGYWYLNISFKYGIYLVILSVAIIIFISDLKYMIILDSPLLIGSILVFILRCFELKSPTAIISILNGIFMFVIMYLIKLLGDKIFKKESLGGGDIKLAFLIGLSLGYPGIGLRLSLISLIFASFLALPYALSTLYLNKKNELPFGPFLISSTLIIFVFLEKFSNLLIIFEL